MSKRRILPNTLHPNIAYSNALQNELQKSAEAAQEEARLNDLATSAALYAKHNPLKAMGISTQFDIDQARMQGIEETMAQVIEELAALRQSIADLQQKLYDEHPSK